MIRIRFAAPYWQAAFDSWFRSFQKHEFGMVSDLTHDARGYHYTITVAP